MVKRVGKYELGRTLGEGTFGKVKYAIDTETNEAVAIKILDKERIQRQNMGSQIKKEISIMKLVKHRHIVSMIEVLASKTKIFIVLELVTGGELFGKIVSMSKLPEEMARMYFQQLIEAVEYCHRLGVCHRDLKPENLLLDEHGNLKVSDFGLSSLYVGDTANTGAIRTELLHTTCGTPNYVAPEVLSEEGYDGKKADVWSSGVILYVLLAGFLPFDESTIVALFEKIKKADFTYPSWFSPQVRDLLDHIFVTDPKVRVSISDIKSHPWFQGDLTTVSGELAATTAAIAEIASARATAGGSSPTQEQIEDAVQLANDDHHEEEDEIPEDGPVKLNAFDLVSHCGGLGIDKMFSPELFYALSRNSMGSDNHITSAASASVTASVAGGGSTLLPVGASGASAMGLNRRVKNFTATGITPQQLTQHVWNALIELGFSSEYSEEKSVSSGVIKAERLSAKGMVGITTQAFYVTDQLSLLEIRKGKGDMLEWNQSYLELEKHIATLINKAGSSEESKDIF